MFIFYILTSGYNWFVDLLIGNNKSVEDKKYADKYVIILGVVLILIYLSAYYIPYVLLILMSMSK